MTEIDPTGGDTTEVVEDLFEKLNNTDVGADGLSRQEENWVLMTLLQMPWHHADKIDSADDRKFLLERAEQIKKMALQAQKAEMERQEEQFKMMQEQQGQQDEGSKIITPSDFMPPV